MPLAGCKFLEITYMTDCPSVPRRLCVALITISSGRRPRAQCVANEMRKALLARKNGDVTTLYCVAALAELLLGVIKIDRGLATPMIALLPAIA